MSFPRYPEYKDSGVEWLGEVPMHWETSKLRYMFSLGKGLSITKEDLLDEGIPCVNYGEVHSKYGFVVDPAINPLRCVSESYLESSQGALLSRGDFVFADTSEDIEGSGNFTQAITDETLFAGYHTVIARPNDKTNHRFYAYLFESREFRTQIQYAVKGVKVFSITQAILRGANIWLPTQEERAAIVNFLDSEIRKIDHLIVEQKKLIELLKEKRQAVISHAVTKGLDSKVKMKDSGVEWLGEVPEHWDNVALKRISPSLTVGIVVNPSNYVAEEGLPFIYGGDIREGKITFETARCISQEDSLRNEKTRLMAGDLLTVRVGYPGITAVVPPECEGGNCASVMHVRRGSFDSRWLCYVMNSRIVRFQVEVVQYGAAQEQFNISHAVEFRVPRPSTDEQREIADFLDHQSGQFDELIAEALQGISLLKERRSALISAAVTGKIDVRKFGK